MLPNSVKLYSGGSGTGNSGNVTIIAGATSGAAIQVGAVDTTGGTGLSGNITIAAASPGISSGSTVVIQNGGQITSSDFVQSTLQPATISTGTLNASGTGSSAGGKISVSTGSSTAFVIGTTGASGVNGSLIASSGSSGGAGGSIAVSAANASVTIDKSKVLNTAVSGTMEARSILAPPIW